MGNVKGTKERATSRAKLKTSLFSALSLAIKEEGRWAGTARPAPGCSDVDLAPWAALSVRGADR